MLDRLWLHAKRRMRQSTQQKVELGETKATEAAQTMRRVGADTDKLTQKKQDEGSDEDEAAAVTDDTDDTRRTKCGPR